MVLSGCEERNTNVAALPVVFYHVKLVTFPATMMSMVGGLVVYCTIIVFSLFFNETEDEY